MSYFKLLDPSKVREPNPTGPIKVNKIKESLSKGWNGLPILVEEGEDKHRFYAWTGSHRLVASRILNIKVPAFVIPSNVLEKSCKTRGSSIRSFLYTFRYLENAQEQSIDIIGNVFSNDQLAVLNNLKILKEYLAYYILKKELIKDGYIEIKPVSVDNFILKILDISMKLIIKIKS